MSFAAPWPLALAAAAAAAVVVLHLLARRRRTALLPTARFVPDAPATATSRALHPSDPLLLALRVLALLLLGAAFAQPYRAPERQPIARVVLLDASRAVGSPDAARDTALARFAAGDALVVFDSVARVVEPGSDPFLAPRRSSAAGSLSAALLAGTRAAANLAGRADSVEMVLVSALVEEQWDTATAAIRALWPGTIRLAPVPAAVADVSPGGSAAGVEIDGADDDPLRATLSLLGPSAGAFPVRIRRGAPGDDDDAWAREPGHLLVRWPAAPAESAAVRRDTVGAVVAGEVVVVAPWFRGAAPSPGRVVARWADGEPAATERGEGAGCIRDVAIPLPGEGDLVLRESTRRLVAALLAPCVDPPRLTPLDDRRLALLAGAGGAVRLDRPARAAAGPQGLAAALLAGAAAILLLETLLRRRRRPQ
jgi:hypothetical protein